MGGSAPAPAVALALAAALAPALTPSNSKIVAKGKDDFSKIFWEVPLLVVDCLMDGARHWAVAGGGLDGGLRIRIYWAVEFRSIGCWKLPCIGFHSGFVVHFGIINYTGAIMVQGLRGILQGSICNLSKFAEQ